MLLSSSCFGRICKFLGVETSLLLANAMVSSRLDYCNSLLYGVSKSNILFKYNLLVFKAINLSQPRYLSALIRSSSLTRSNRLSVSSIHPKKHICRCGFAVAAPAEWHKLPQTARSQQTINGFRSQLKTHLFRLAYPPP